MTAQASITLADESEGHSTNAPGLAYFAMSRLLRLGGKDREKTEFAGLGIYRDVETPPPGGKDQEKYERAGLGIYLDIETPPPAAGGIKKERSVLINQLISSTRELR
jgi:hypothetical protein